jgi:dATP pyrophosphohydrolase
MAMADDSSAPRPAYKFPESVLVVIHTADLQVLLLERTDSPGFWQSVTGSRDDADEALAATAIREVFEETGIVVGSAEVPAPMLRDWHASIDYEIYPRWRHRYAPGVTRNTEHRFSLEVPRDVAISLSPREHLRHRWLPQMEAATACFSTSNAAAIRELGAFR